MGQALDHRLITISDYPYTISFTVRKSLQIESFHELTKKQQPPESIWDNSKELELWLENLGSGEANTAEFIIPEWEIE